MIVLAGLVVVPHLGESLFPEFKERDFLMHWISKPGTSLPEERPDRHRGGSRPPVDPGRADVRVPHRAGARSAEEIVGVELR